MTIQSIRILLLLFAGDVVLSNGLESHRILVIDRMLQLILCTESTKTLFTL